MELAIMKHNAEETFEVTVAPEYGYGDQEVKRPGGVVPPNSQLLYTVQILEIEKVCVRLKPRWRIVASHLRQAMHGCGPCLGHD